MYQFSRRFAALALVALTSTAHAGPIVTIGGNYWLQPVDFLNFSWNAIHSRCNATTGSCSGILGVTDLTGYTWGSLDDVNTLFNVILGNSDSGPGPDFVTYAPGTVMPLFSTAGFLPTANTNAGYIAGWTRTPNAHNTAFTGFAGSYDFNNYVTWTSASLFLNSRGPDIGGWFFRAEQSPHRESRPLQLPH